MEWELILVKLLVALMVVIVGGFCVIGFMWFWCVMNEDLVRHYRQINKARRKWRKRE